MPQTSVNKKTSIKKEEIYPVKTLKKAFEEDPNSKNVIQGFYNKMAGYTNPVSYGSVGDNNLPVVSHPWMFQKDPNIIGMGLAKAYQDIIKVAPALGSGNVPEIRYGPNKATMFDLKSSGFSPDEMGRTNLAGATNNLTNAIAINPNVESLMGTDYVPSGTGLYGTLTHELIHSKGYGEDIAHNFNDVYDKEIDKDRNKAIDKLSPFRYLKR